MEKMKLSILNDDDLKSIVIFRTPRRGVRRRELGCNLLQQVPKALVSCATTYSKNHGLNLWKGSKLWYDFYISRG